MLYRRRARRVGSSRRPGTGRVRHGVGAAGPPLESVLGDEQVDATGGRSAPGAAGAAGPEQRRAAVPAALWAGRRERAAGTDRGASPRDAAHGGAGHAGHRPGVGGSVGRRVGVGAGDVLVRAAAGAGRPALRAGAAAALPAPAGRLGRGAGVSTGAVSFAARPEPCRGRDRRLGTGCRGRLVARRGHGCEFLPGKRTDRKLGRAATGAAGLVRGVRAAGGTVSTCRRATD